MEDKEIIALYLERNEVAIGETEQRYGRLCLSIAKNVLGDEEDAKECVNDAYFCLWNQIPPDEPENLTAYLGTIVRRLSLKKLDYKLAKKRSAQVVVSLSELEETLPDEGFSEGVESRELGRMISEFLRGEKEVSRAVFLRRYFFFDSVADIAARYKFSESKVKSMLFHTRNKLKAYLKKEGVVL